MNELRVTLWQTDIAWKGKLANLEALRDTMRQEQGRTDLLILPETFSTGFCRDPLTVAEPVTGDTIRILRQWAEEYGMALAGSYLSTGLPGHDGSSLACCYNRAFFLPPEGQPTYYDKRHLFRSGGEKEEAGFRAGHQRPIAVYREWKICLQVCYDLRFPVWSRNVGGDEYDLLIYVANWPESRREVWDVLLRARAIENQSYVCGVNRIGTDHEGWVAYNGGSTIYSPAGKLLARLSDNEEGTATATLDLKKQQDFRQRCPYWKDFDSFRLASSRAGQELAT